MSLYLLVTHEAIRVMRLTHQQWSLISYGMRAVQVCASTACFGFVSEISHEQLFTAACLFLRAIMGKRQSISKRPDLVSIIIVLSAHEGNRTALQLLPTLCQRL